jgi:hypothetical protein
MAVIINKIQQDLSCAKFTDILFVVNLKNTVMKNTLLLLAFHFMCIPLLSAQVIYQQNFDGLAIGSTPPNWEVSSNTNINAYEKPFDCLANRGLQTPGVGKTTPTRFILPLLNYDQRYGIIKISFSVFVMDANLKCISAKPFPCPTYVHVMLLHDSYAGGINSLPAAGDIFSEQTYQIKVANGSNTLIFNNPPVSGENYLIYFDFKTAENTNCTGAGTKFIFDDFTIDQSPCLGDCPPVANNDYFSGKLQGFNDTIRANVYGGFLLWSSEARSGYERKSLSMEPAINSGVDYDVNNHTLSEMTFEKIGADLVYSNNTCDTLNLTGEVVWNKDGSFEYVRLSNCITKIIFQYRVVDPTGLADTAIVTVDFKTFSILPVKLTSFTAKGTGNYVNLNWETSWEENTEGFYIQRNTGEGWTERGFVPVGRQGTGYAGKYSFTDNNYFLGTSQYRLKIVDNDGRTEYSNICIVRRTDDVDVLVYPNPTFDGNIKIELPSAANYTIELISAGGAKLGVYQSMSNRLYTIRNLKSGIYLMLVKESSGRCISTRKVIVQ